jgi:hypothetical protein
MPLLLSHLPWRIGKIGNVQDRYVPTYLSSSKLIEGNEGWFETKISSLSSVGKDHFLSLICDRDRAGARRRGGSPAIGHYLLAWVLAGRIVCGMRKVVGSSSPAGKAADLTIGYRHWCHNLARNSWRG